MILIIDNYDSFTYNLVQLVGGMNPDIAVIRSDAMTTEELEALSPRTSSFLQGRGIQRTPVSARTPSKSSAANSRF
jgi:hypothetical protein